MVVSQQGVSADGDDPVESEDFWVDECCAEIEQEAGRR